MLVKIFLVPAAAAAAAAAYHVYKEVATIIAHGVPVARGEK